MFRGFFYITLIGGIVSDPIKPNTTEDKGKCGKKTYYSCETPINQIEWNFNVNITLNMSASLKDYRAFVIQSKDLDNTWFYMKNTLLAFPPNTNIRFSLTYKGFQPAGNCTWYFEAQETSSELPIVSSIPFNESEISTETTTEVMTSLPESTSQSSPNISTTTELSNSSSESCLCSCPCGPKSQESIEELMRYIINDLVIAKNSTYQARQRLISASDQRWISRGIGFVGVLVMTLVFGTILAGDLKVFAENTKMALNRIRGR